VIALIVAEEGRFLLGAGRSLDDVAGGIGNFNRGVLKVEGDSWREQEDPGKVSQRERLGGGWTS